MINLTCPSGPLKIDLDEYITFNFKWREALYHKQWDEFVFPKEDQFATNIFAVSLKLEKIRSMFEDRPITIHSWLRGEKYNKLIRGAKFSQHVKGAAVDFSIKGIPAHEVRNQLEDKLETLGIRMERLDKSDDWIHIDIKPPTNGNRYFEP